MFSVTATRTRTEQIELHTPTPETLAALALLTKAFSMVTAASAELLADLSSTADLLTLSSDKSQRSKELQYSYHPVTRNLYDQKSIDI